MLRRFRLSEIKLLRIVVAVRQLVTKTGIPCFCIVCSCLNQSEHFHYMSGSTEREDCVDLRCKPCASGTFNNTSTPKGRRTTNLWVKIQVSVLWYLARDPADADRFQCTYSSSTFCPVYWTYTSLSFTYFFKNSVYQSRYFLLVCLALSWFVT